MKTTVSSHYRTFHHFAQRNKDGEIDATGGSVLPEERRIWGIPGESSV